MYNRLPAFQWKNYEFEAKFTQKWYTLSGFKLLSIFVSWANYRHLYSNSRARTVDWNQTWMTAVLDSSSGFILVDFWTFPQASFLEKWENLDYSLWIDCVWSFWFIMTILVGSTEKRCVPKHLQMPTALLFLSIFILQHVLATVLEMVIDNLM